MLLDRLNNPLTQIGLGILANNGNVGRGALLGLQNVRQMQLDKQRQEQDALRNQYLQFQIKQAEAQEAQRQQQQNAIQSVIGQRQQTAPFVADTFPGESPIKGLETITRKGSGLLGNYNVSPVQEAQLSLLGSGAGNVAGALSDVFAPAPLSPYEQARQKALGTYGLDVNATGEQLQNARLASNKAGAPVVNVGGQSYKVPDGFMLKDPQDPNKGITPIPGGPRDNLTTENAAKTQSLKTAADQVPKIRNLIFDEEGGIDRVNLANAAIGTPFTDGRTLDQLYEFGIQAITRGETGAAMPPEELLNTAKRFKPSLADSDEMIEAKVNIFEDFLNGTIKLIDPSGRFNEDRFQSELTKKLRNKDGSNNKKEAEKQKPLPDDATDNQIVDYYLNGGGR